MLVSIGFIAALFGLIKVFAGTAEYLFAWGGWIASQRGAMPPLDDATLATVTEQIHSAGNRAALS